MKIIDISVPIDKNLPLWPKSSGFRLTKINENESHIEMNAHVGTHLDAPLHFIPKGLPIDKMPLSTFVGPALVTSPAKIKDIPKGTERALFKTSNSKLWAKNGNKFHEGYIGLTTKEAELLVKRKIKLVGIDYLSIAKFEEAKEVHKILLKSGMAILEGLNLTIVKPGKYQLICLPVKISNIEASPTRAILVK